MPSQESCPARSHAKPGVMPSQESCQAGSHAKLESCQARSQADGDGDGVGVTSLIEGSAEFALSKIQRPTYEYY